MSDNPLFDKYGQTLRDGEVICRENDPGDRMFIIQSGSVSIHKQIDGREHKLAELGKGEFFGEMAIVSNTPRSATAIAVGQVEILSFDRAGFEAMIAKNTKIAMSIIDKLSRRLQNANSQIQTLVRSNQRSMVALNLYNRFMERDGGTAALTMDRAVEEIALELNAPRNIITDLIDNFVHEGILELNENALRLKNKARLVALTDAKD